MAEIVQSLFGVSPQMYQQQQADAADARALQFAKLDPFQQANFSIGRGASQLVGALGGQDPELQMITARNQIAKGLNPNDPASFEKAMQQLRDIGDFQGQMQLAPLMDEATKRSKLLASQSRSAEAQRLIQGAYRPATPEQQQFVQVDEQGQPVNLPGREASYNLGSALPKLMQSAEGRAAITEQANLLPALRKLGAANAPQDNPFAAFTGDATLPKTVQIVAQQLSKSFANGTLDPEKVDAKIQDLSNMNQRVQQFEQSQQQIKTAQEQANSLRLQGLEQSGQFKTLTAQIAQQSLTLAQDRARFDQDSKTQAAAEKKTAAANKPLPGYLAKEEEADYSAAQAATNMATDAYGYVNRIKSGEIPFGIKNIASIRARQLVGSGDPDVIARETYDKFLRDLVAESLRLNKGTQTENDYKVAVKNLGSSESKEAAASNMNKLIEVSKRLVGDSAKSVETRRANANFPPPVRPIETPKFDIQIITPTEYNSFLKNSKFPSGTIFVDPDGVRRVKP